MPSSSKKRFSIFQLRLKFCLRREKNMETPITNRKLGKIKSVGVIPFQEA